MREFTRIMLNRKTLLLLLVFIILNSCLFLYQCSDINRTASTEQDEVPYREAYPEFIASVQKTSKQMQVHPLYKDHDTFAYRNLIQTYEDYSQFSGITVKDGENRGITALLNSGITDIFLLVMVIYLVLQLIEERKCGLIFLTRSTSRGRVPLNLKRIGVLFLSVSLLCIIFYGGNLLLSQIFFGDAGLLRPLQSVPALMHCTLPLSLAAFLLLLVCIKILAGMLLALLLYTLLGILAPVLALGGFTLLAGLEFFLYYIIKPTQSLNILKYTNLYCLLNTRDYFVDYLNLNIGGRPVSTLSASLTFFPILLLVLVILCPFIHSVQYSTRGNRIQQGLTQLFQRIPRPSIQLPLLLWEGKKVFFTRKGIFILAAVFCLAVSSANNHQYMVSSNQYETMWYEKYNRTIDQSLMNEMEYKEASLRTNIRLLEEEIDKTSQKMMSPDTSPAALSNMSESISQNEERLTEYRKMLGGLHVVQERALEGYEYSLASGRSIRLIQPHSYQLYFTSDIKTLEMNSLYILFAIVGIFAGIMSYEKETKMKATLNTLTRGRFRLFLNKVFWVFLISVSVSLIIHMLQFTDIRQQFGFNDLDAPIQSMECLRSLEFNFNFWELFIFLFSARMLVAFLFGMVVLLISSVCRNNLTALTFCVFLLIVPNAFSFTGMLPSGFLSPMKLVGVTQLLTM